MLPIFSRRSLLGILIGLVLGLACGFAFTALDIANAEFRAGWPPIKMASETDNAAYEASVQGRMLPSTNDETFIRTMDQQEQYYVARMGSLPFFQYFSNFLDKNAPQYSHTPEELSRRIHVSFVTLADNPSVIQIKAGFSTEPETIYMVENLPQVFQEYIQAEQNSLQNAAYARKTKQLDTVRADYEQAVQNLVNASIKANTPEQVSTITATQEYIELAAQIEALEQELNKQSDTVASLLAQGSSPSSTASSSSITAVAANETTPGTIEAKIKGLEEALQQKSWVAAGFTLSDGSSSSSLPSISVLSEEYQAAIAYQYANALKSIELTSTELSQAQAQMDILQAKINQDKVDRENANAPSRIDYDLAADQVSALSDQLASVTREFKAMSETVVQSQIISFYTASAPAEPDSPGPGKTAPLLGALLGMFCGWLVVNRRWLAGSSNPIAVEDRPEGPTGPAVLNEPDIDAKEAAALEEMRSWSVRPSRDNNTQSAQPGDWGTGSSATDDVANQSEDSPLNDESGNDRPEFKEDGAK